MSNRFYDAVIDSPVGILGIRLQDNRLRQIEFLDDEIELQAAISPVAQGVVAAISDYFETGRFTRNLNIELEGTEFQRRVWKELQAIPSGRVTTYGALAEKLGTSARAVGNACRRNPVPVLVPCHRVVARSGLGGFAGDHDGRLVAIKKRLLALEGVEINGARPHMT
jgi:methylated-DNA-[protein]-cysteine S-methyltransferase